MGDEIIDPNGTTAMLEDFTPTGGGTDDGAGAGGDDGGAGSAAGGVDDGADGADNAGAGAPSGDDDTGSIGDDVLASIFGEEPVKEDQPGVDDGKKPDAAADDPTVLWGEGKKYATQEDALKSIPDRERLLGESATKLQEAQREIERLKTQTVDHMAMTDPDAAKEQIETISRKSFNERADLVATLMTKGKEGLRDVIKSIIAEEQHVATEKARVDSTLKGLYPETWERMAPQRESIVSAIKAKKITLPELVHLASIGRSVRDAHLRGRSTKSNNNPAPPGRGAGGGGLITSPGKTGKSSAPAMNERVADFDADMDRYGANAGFETRGY